MRGHPGRHVLRHYLCAFCDVVMCEMDDIEAHLEKAHVNKSCTYKTVRDVIMGAEKPPKCLLCSEQFSLYSVLLQHIQMQHGANGVDRHTAEGILLVDDCQVIKDIKKEESQCESLSNLQVHKMNQDEAADVYKTLTSMETTAFLDNHQVEGSGIGGQQEQNLKVENDEVGVSVQCHLCEFSASDTEVYDEHITSAHTTKQPTENVAEYFASGEIKSISTCVIHSGESEKISTCVTQSEDSEEISTCTTQTEENEKMSTCATKLANDKGPFCLTRKRGFSDYQNNHVK